MRRIWNVHMSLGRENKKPEVSLVLYCCWGSLALQMHGAKLSTLKIKNNFVYKELKVVKIKVNLDPKDEKFQHTLLLLKYNSESCCLNGHKVSFSLSNPCMTWNRLWLCGQIIDASKMWLIHN